MDPDDGEDADDVCRVVVPVELVKRIAYGMLEEIDVWMTSHDMREIDGQVMMAALVAASNAAVELFATGPTPHTTLQ